MYIWLVEVQMKNILENKLVGIFMQFPVSQYGKISISYLCGKLLVRNNNLIALGSFSPFQNKSMQNNGLKIFICIKKK